MTDAKEREFLAEWEQDNPKPEKETQKLQWYMNRDRALGVWRVEQEQKEREEQKKKLEHRQKELYMAQAAAGTKTVERETVPPLLKGITPFDEKHFEKTDFSVGLSLFTVLACLSSLPELMELGEQMSLDGKEPALEQQKKLWQDTALRHRQDVTAMQRLCDRGQCAHVVDRVQKTMEQIMSVSVPPERRQRNLLEYVGNQMVKVFYQMEDAKDPRTACFKKIFKERDKTHVLQRFYAYKRMTEILTLYEATLEKMKRPDAAKEHLSEQELRDYLMGSFVSRELKKTMEHKSLTKEAMLLGEVHTKTGASGGIEVTFGDEEIYRRMQKEETYRKLKGMTAGEITEMFRKRKPEKKADPLSPAERSLKQENQKKMSPSGKILIKK